jgi:hypothetical protein
MPICFLISGIFGLALICFSDLPVKRLRCFSKESFGNLVFFKVASVSIGSISTNISSFVVPTSKINFWTDKFNSVKISDNENLKKNLADGWKVIDLWECVIKKEKFLENELKKYLFINGVYN